MSKEKSTETVLVTGASMGIGEALARRFAGAGHDLVLVARSADKLKLLADELTNSHGIKVVTIAADLARDGEVARLAATLKRRRLAIDILVNSAGINHLGHFEKMDLAAHQAIIRLNIAAATEMMSCFIPPMMDAMAADNSRFVKLIAPTVLDVTEVADAGFDACMRGQVLRVPGRVNLLTTLSSRAMPKWVTRRAVGLMARKAH